MDSIVDSYFPHLEIIEKEVQEIERRVYSAGQPDGLLRGDRPRRPRATPVAGEQSSSDSNPSTLKEISNSEVDEKETPRSPALEKPSKPVRPRTRFVSPGSFPLMMRRARRTVVDVIASIPRFKAIDTTAPGYYHPTTTISRMARIRR